MAKLAEIVWSPLYTSPTNSKSSTGSSEFERFNVHSTYLRVAGSLRAGTSYLSPLQTLEREVGMEKHYLHAAVLHQDLHSI
jgi:hypothetical protein